MGEASDRDLYLAACSGDRHSFQQLVERHHSYTFRLAANLVGGGSAAAEDVAHKAWLNVCQHVKKVQDGQGRPLELTHDASFMAWLKTVTSNVAKDEYRRRDRQDYQELTDEDSVVTPDFDEGMIAEERRSAVWAAFKRLSERCRELLLLLVHDPPLDYKTIAELWGRPVGAIGPTRARCIGELRALL
jgi:RNA polymerase sigma factor (sigma-70 family)